LAANEETRSAAGKELASASSQNEKLADAIHSSTLIQLELRSQVSMLKSVHLSPPFETLAPSIIDFDQLKIDLHQTMIDISSAFLAGPKPGVDYGKMATEMPKIRAVPESIDQTLFKVLRMVFATLIDQKPDSQNHLGRLVITKSERDELVHDTEVSIGDKLYQDA
jgi:hypothetical protein